MKTPRTIRTPVVAALASLLVLAGCGSDDGDSDRADDPVETPGTADGTDSSTSDDGGFPVTVTPANGEVTIDARPERIVVLAPSLTETVFAIGAGDQVIAVDEMSNFPEDAPVTDLSGYEPNIEAIADQEPDLVIASDSPDDLVSGLGTVGVPVLMLPAAGDLDEAFAQIELVGVATGHADAAADLVEELQERVDTAIERVPDGDPVTYFHELDDTLYTVTSSTFIGQMYGLAGFENIADDADPDGHGYPQISDEALIEADPDAIFLADVDCCGQSAETVSKRAGWSEMTAVANGAIFELDDDIASRWGPRIVDLLEQLVDIRLDLAADGELDAAA